MVKKVKLRILFLLALVLSIILSVYLILKSLEKDVVFFLSPTDIKNLEEIDTKKIRVGGMVKNKWFSQFLSNVINTKVIRPKVQETTALGAAFMAGLKIGVYKSLSDISKNWKIDQKFIPKISKRSRTNLLKGWEQAIRKTLI